MLKCDRCGKEITNERIHYWDFNHIESGINPDEIFRRTNYAHYFCDGCSDEITDFLNKMFHKNFIN